MPTKKEWEQINNARQGYIAKKNAQNEQITTLTEEQHEVIQWLCSVRHEIHSSWRGMFNVESADRDLLKHLDSIYDEYSINLRLASVGLSSINFGINPEWIAGSDDYDYTEDEDKEEYENKAEKDPRGMTAYELWYEDAYEIFCSDMSKVNDAIENYLVEIDKKHGTNYCPSGWQRMN